LVGGQSLGVLQPLIVFLPPKMYVPVINILYLSNFFSFVACFGKGEAFKAA
jgi:hypothetical protein